MRRASGLVLQIIGWLGALWCAAVGGSFTLVYLVGFVGTSGREAGGELIVMLTMTLGGVLIGFLLAKLGRWLMASGAEVDASAEL